MATKIKNTPPFDGALIIDKPSGMTSHDVVSRLRRILRTKKIGHTGTLDPFATGVLVMLVGKGTRLARFLDKDEKSYEAVLRFGFETDTGDREGKPKEYGRQGTGVGESLKEKGKRKNEKTSVENLENGIPEPVDMPSKIKLISMVNSVLSEFRGEILQVPPMYSAKKVKGKKLYELARQGIEIEREPVAVTIFELEVIENADSSVHSGRNTPASNEIILKVSCSAGTYIRTLAEDIGRRIGVGCHLSELRRTKAGGFTLAHAITLEDTEQISDSGHISASVVAMSDIVAHLPAQILDDDEVRRVASGLSIGADASLDSGLEIRLMDAADQLVAIGMADLEGNIRPKAVFNSA